MKHSETSRPAAARTRRAAPLRRGSLTALCLALASGAIGLSGCAPEPETGVSESAVAGSYAHRDAVRNVLILYDDATAHATAEAVARLYPNATPQFVARLESFDELYRELDALRHQIRARRRAPFERVVWLGHGGVDGPILEALVRGANDVEAGVFRLVSASQPGTATVREVAWHRFVAPAELTAAKADLRRAGLVGAMGDGSLQDGLAYLARVFSVLGRHGLRLDSRLWSSFEHCVQSATNQCSCEDHDAQRCPRPACVPGGDTCSPTHPLFGECTAAAALYEDADAYEGEAEFALARFAEALSAVSSADALIYLGHCNAATAMPGYRDEVSFAELLARLAGRHTAGSEGKVTGELEGTVSRGHTLSLIEALEAGAAPRRVEVFAPTGR